MGRAQDTEDTSDPTLARDDKHDTNRTGPSAYPREVNPTAAPLEDGSHAERYEVRRQLGIGSMGEVDLCRDLRIGREVAKKSLLPNHRSDATLRGRFLRECRIQGQLEHPSIVPVYDLGVDEDGATFFTMKCLRGLTLKQIVRSLRDGDPEAARKFNARRLLTAFSAVCLTVDFAHTRGSAGWRPGTLRDRSSADRGRSPRTPAPPTCAPPRA